MPRILKITVSIAPGGVGPERRLVELHIANVGGDARADYRCTLFGSDLAAPGQVSLTRYQAPFLSESFTISELASLYGSYLNQPGVVIDYYNLESVGVGSYWSSEEFVSNTEEAWRLGP